MAVTIEDIKDLMPGCTVSDNALISILATAERTITAVCTGINGVSADDLTALTTWYACHMVASGPMLQTKKEKLGEAEVEYNITTGTDLNATTYGKVVLSLDRWGVMKKLGKQAVYIKAATSFK